MCGLLAVMLLAAGCGGASASDVERTVTTKFGERAAKCRDAGEAASGDTIFKCDVTLKRTRAFPELAGEHVERCYRGGPDDIAKADCSLLHPENDGRPKE